MNLVKAALACSFALAFTSLATAQSSPFSPANKTTGKTARADARPRTLGDETSNTAAASSSVGGLIEATFTIKVNVAIPSGGAVYCELNASVSDENTSTFTINNEIFEEATVKATVNGSTATCQPKIHYSWNLQNASNDTVNLTYSIAVAASGASTTTPQLVSRTSSQYVPGAGSIKVPANGAVTSFTIAATI